ncbi:unnamed protein product [Nyctereutes procyonoides]|uniref:(raccoon dog) hypothetical protein n=1 Tax=Nyctereutes procyonoides TaxID=34880 RepID=A0A811YIW2_NYCPR|nr:unnamed protein product [Nyctereutes procyonoides]
MEETLPQGCSKQHLEKLTLGITCILKSPLGLHEDLKNFYLTPLHREAWRLTASQNSKLTPLNQSSTYSFPNAPTLADLEDDTLESCSVIFELDPCNGNRKVCLVYETGKPIVLLNFLTDTFTTYYHLLITHLGLLQWQYQWFNMCKLITYNTDLLAEETSFLVNKPGSQQRPVQPAGGQKGPEVSLSTSNSSSGPGNLALFWK